MSSSIDTMSSDFRTMNSTTSNANLSTTASSSATLDQAGKNRGRLHLSWTGLPGFMAWCSIIALFFLIIGYATTGWYQRPSEMEDFGTREVGLWEVCECSGYRFTPHYVKATQAFATMALIALISATMSTISYMLIEFLPKTLFIMGAFISFIVSATCLLVTIAVYGAESSKENEGVGNPSYSFAFSVICMLICIGGSIMTFFQMRKSRVC